MQKFGSDSSVRPSARYIALCVLGLCSALLLSGRTIVGWMLHETHGIGWKTPPGSYSLNSTNHVNEFFPGRMRGAIVMALEAKPGTSSVLSDAVEAFSLNVSKQVKKDDRVKPYDPIVVGYYLNRQLSSGMRKHVQQQLITPDEKMTVIVIQPTKMEGEWNDAASFLEEFCSNPPEGYTLHITGMMSVLKGDGCFNGIHSKVNTRNMNFEGLFRAEVITIPIALVVIGALVKFYVKLLILPLITLSVSFVLFALFLLPFMDTVRIPNDVPAATGSVMLALCLDYGLFFLTRFSEQNRQGMPLQDNVDTILHRTGKTITISGTLVAIAFFGSMILPEENLKSTGLAMGIACIAAMITSIVLLPSMLLVGGRMLTGALVRNPTDIDMQDHTRRVEELSMDETAQYAHKETSHWLNAMRLMDRNPKKAIGLVCLVMTPLFLCLPHLAITGDRFAMMPMDMPAMSALRRIQDKFPMGILDPYAIVITAPTDVKSERLSLEVQDGVDQLASHDIKAMGMGIGLSSEEASSFANAVKGLKDGEAKGKATELAKKVNCQTLAAMGAGVAIGTTDVSVDGKTVGDVDVNDAHVLKSALRAARKSGCSAEEVQKAVGASAVVLYSLKDEQTRDKVKDVAKDEGKKGVHEGKKAATDKTLQHKAIHTADDLQEEVGTEALKLGFSKADATHIGERVTNAAKKLHEKDADSSENKALRAAVRAGRAVGLGKLHGQGDFDSLKDSVSQLNVEDLTMEQASEIIHAAMVVLQEGEDEAADANNESHKEVEKGIKAVKENKAVQLQAKKHKINEHTAAVVAAALMSVTKKGGKETNEHVKLSGGAKDAVKPVVAGTEVAGAEVVSPGSTAPDKQFHKRMELVLQLTAAVDKLSGKDRGLLLLPSGFKAMMDLSDTVQKVGDVSSMIGPMRAFNQTIDWVTAVAMNMDSNASKMFDLLLASHSNGHRGLLEVHTTFPSLGPKGADWVLDVRSALADWEQRHPGYKAELAGGASEAADTRTAVIGAMWPYLLISVTGIMMVVLLAFRSIMVPLRLAFALFFTLAATYGMAFIIYQTPLLHALFPWLKPFYGLTYEVVPMVTGVAIALGLDYDIFLVTRIVEFRMNGFTDRASVFRGATKAGGVISGAGLIMSLAFTGLCFSDKMLMQQFGTLLITSVVFDTFVVRTVLVPSLMLVAQDYNWWPRQMPKAYRDQLEGPVEDYNSPEDPSSNCIRPEPEDPGMHYQAF